MNDTRSYLSSYFPDLVFYNEPVTDSCLVGVALLCDSRHGPCWVAAYSEDLVFEELIKRFGEEDAADWYDYNILGTYAGGSTPIFVIQENKYAQRFEGRLMIMHLNECISIENAYQAVQDDIVALYIPLNDIERIVDYV